MAKLIIRDGKGGELVHEIKDDVTTFGRSSANIIPMKDEKASRQHFRIEKAGDSYRLIDLGSRNGTEVNGVRVSSQTLKPGDVIVVGEYKVTFDAPMQVSGDELGATVACEPLSDKDLGVHGSAPAAAPAPAKPAAAAASAPAAAKSGDPAAPRFTLEVVEGPSKGKNAELGLEPVTIGRHASNKLAIEDEAASNYHAEVTKEAIGYVISDLGSTNGTKVNGEKIVKSPLAHNARIRIGSTEIVFRNLGAPTEEDAVFGTVVLDSDKLDKELAAAKSGGGLAAAVKFVAVLAVLGGLGTGGYFGVKYLLNRPGNKITETVKTELVNGPFSEGIDNNGNPKGWLLFPGDDRNSIVVEKGKGTEPAAAPGQPEVEKYSLKFQRESATRPDTLMECRQSGVFQVEAGKGYRASVMVSSPGALGLYGLQLTWIESDEEGARRLTEPALIAGAHPDWDKVEIETRPPTWASRLTMSLVAYGNSGNVFFDDARFEAVPADKVALRGEKTVEFKLIRARFDSVGRLDLERGAERALSGQIVAEGQGKTTSRQELAQPAKGYPIVKEEDTTFKGSIFDFSRRQRFNYQETASKADDGVKLAYSFGTDSVDLTLSRLELQFLVEPAFAARAEAYTADGRKPLAAENNGVTELILGGAKGELVLGFAQPATVNIESVGQRKRLSILVAKEPSLGPAATKDFVMTFGTISARAVGERQAAFAAVAKLFEDKTWKDFPERARQIREKYPTANEDVAKTAALETQYQAKFDDAERQVKAAVRRAQEAGTILEAWQTAYDQGKELLPRIKQEWNGAKSIDGKRDMTEILSACEVDLEMTKKSREAATREKAAKAALDRAQPFVAAKQPSAAKAFLKRVVDDFPGTEAAKIAEKQIEECDKMIAQQTYVDEQEQRLLKTIRNFELNNQWDRVVSTIENDAAYKKYSAEMKEITQHLEDARAKTKKD